MRMKIRAAVEAANEPGILVMAGTDCRPTVGIGEARARIAIYVEERADLLFPDPPKDADEIRRAVAAAGGRPSLAVMSPGTPRETPTQTRAAEPGRKIGMFPTGMLSPAVAGINAGLAANAAGGEQAEMAPAPAASRGTPGHDDDERQTRRFTVPGG
jgi:2-methylisocitrate lyase-like PEP mutase family enzyme